MNNRPIQDRTMHGPGYFRWRHFIGGIYDTVNNTARACLLIAATLTVRWGKTTPGFVKGLLLPVTVVLTIISFIAVAALSFTGLILGGIFGILRGAFHAITRKPAPEAEILGVDRKINFLSEERNAHHLQRVTAEIVARYTAEKTVFSSGCSKKILERLNGNFHGVDYLQRQESDFIRAYLINDMVENNGKKLHRIILDVLKNFLTPTQEARRNVTLLAQVYRQNADFHRLPRDVVRLIAERTVDPVAPIVPADILNVQDIAAVRGEAEAVATETNNRVNDMITTTFERVIPSNRPEPIFTDDEANVTLPDDMPASAMPSLR